MIMITNKITLFLILIFSSYYMIAQELNCQVSVIAPTLQGNDQNREIKESLKAAAFEFMNETVWTNDNFKPEERIECNILINISKVVSANVYEGTMQITSSRPVYNSSYKTQILNINDKNIRFKYVRNTAFNFRPTTASEGLVDILAYYAYIILGTDYDTFSLKGGQPYFLKAQQIVSNHSNEQNDKGWSAKFTNNRFQYLNNLLQEIYEPLRQCYYDYHMKGMDIFYNKKEEAVKNIFNAVKLLDEIYKTRPGNYNTQAFFNAKSNELVDIFIETPTAMRMQAYSLFAKLDPGHISKYNTIKKGKR